ncbi:spore germination protein KA/spore germination protein [Anaerospora hongkongensis]|uniref:Spore germination protein KA/spore germination protein n=1 Tax=Anaerospora hongkongensis TaxID=244830 RepID=A0A4R1Q0S3_9FIRM|nr:spore germination protein [Anaerospora hongkongensis]TCL38332.1 spore germination protein KA/spore germination protein [Anaerospora hongkongensis]
MANGKRQRVHKLSAVFAPAATATTSENLRVLRRLINGGAEVGEALSALASHLRQVAAPQNEPFMFMPDLSQNKRLLEVVFRDCSDVKYRDFMLGEQNALLVYVDGMAGNERLDEFVLAPLLKFPQTDSITSLQVLHGLLPVVSLKNSTSAAGIITDVMSGFAALFIDGIADCLLIEARQYRKRPINITQNETVILGSHEAFNEDLSDSIALIRRRCRDNNIKVRMLQIGERSKTAVALIYAANLVKPGLLEEVEQRLKRIKIDRITSTSNVEEQIIDHPWSPFPQTQSTERPDKVVASLYEGRVAIFLDNISDALLVPTTYAQILQAAEDYSTPALVTSLTRVTRFFSTAVAIFLPAFYIALVSYHPGMIPTALAISLAEQRLRSPFPAFMEALFMEVLIELFQEAVIRLPQKISGAAGVVGALVIGTTVVEAGLVNALLVVITSLTAIASFTMPTYSFSTSLRVLRVPTIIMASVLGLYGIALSLMVIVTHLCSLRSFGESYGGNLFNITLLRDWKDTFFRFPNTLLRNRPKQMGSQDENRMGKKDS